MNILCIDFNYIFSSCIRLYADRVNELENPTTSWKMLEHNFGIESIVTYDASTLMKIVKLIKKVINNTSSKLEALNDYIPIIENIINTDTTNVKITNISFFDHMDVNSGRGKTGILRYEKYTNRNWLAYLKLKEYSREINWVKSPNSTVLKDSNTMYTNIYNSIDCIIEDDCTYDNVYLIRSPIYVPYKYQHLIDIILECLGS